MPVHDRGRVIVAYYKENLKMTLLRSLVAGVAGVFCLASIARAGEITAPPNAPPASLLGMALCSGAAGDEPSLWPKEKAWQWYDGVAPIRGVNYVPSTAVNMLEWWQKETFDPATIDRELKWANECGYNSIRCNLSFEVWESDPEGLKARLDQFFAIAAKHKLTVMLCLFDDVNFAKANPVLGRQPEPVPGIHNSRWVPSPAPAKVTDRTAWPALEKYVKNIIGRFREDKRVLVWDLYNEPGNGGLGGKSLPLVEAAFQWARAMKPVQPLTVGPCRLHNSGMTKAMAELSDVVTFHNYSSVEALARNVAFYQKYQRPVICTETIRRQKGLDFAAVLPLFARNKVSWYNWGLVAGKQQTYLPWENKGLTINDHWHWDMLWPDGRPYDPNEVKLIKNFKFESSAPTDNPNSDPDKEEGR